jgi:CDP-diacylglycerol--serine O-phosphatidyltransferase
MACVMAFQYNYTGVFIFVALAAVFDFLDGLAARALHAYSDLGKELDSLSDVVSFGVAPGCLVYSFLASYADGTGLPFIAFLLPIFAALRLAKFNIDTRQTSSFLGLPVPSMGLFWVSFIPSIYLFTQSYSPLTLVIVVALVIVFSALMVSEIPMFSLKFKSL